MTTEQFADRLSAGCAHEERVAKELEARGWDAEEWGQGAFKFGSIRAALRELDSPLRYLPDLIATRDGSIYLIDCKTRMTSTATSRHSINRMSFRAQEKLAVAFDVPIYYVFDDLRVMSTWEVQLWRPETRGAYYLIETRHARPFDAVFGTFEQIAAARHLRAA